MNLYKFLLKSKYHYCWIFYQVQPICDTRFFKNNIDSLDTKIWMEKIKCIETSDAPKWWTIH
jgi:hypothetical protein